jgi:thioredoxin reductase (NADPH)
VVDDLLTDWEADMRQRESEGGVRVVGHRFSQESHAIRDFLARNLVPYRWLDVERDTEAQRLLEASGATGDRLPVVVFEDGSHLEVPDTLAVAERVGISTSAREEFYDLVIVGGGPRAWRPRCTAPARAWRPCSSSARRPAARPAPRRGSRTTSASPPA